MLEWLHHNYKKGAPMTDNSENKDFSFDCAKNFLNSLRFLFPDWTIEQIKEYWTAQEDWNSLRTLSDAYRIMHGLPVERLDLSAALPPAPPQTKKEELKISVSPRALESIVSKGFEFSYKWINWPHYENILKLYTISVLYKQNLTQQQQIDVADLRKAIEFVGNKGRVKPLTAEEISRRQNGRYLTFGKRVIDAIAKEDAFESLIELQSLGKEIREERNYYNALHLQKVMDKSRSIFCTIQNRYHTIG